jgi:hypothetical protein
MALTAFKVARKTGYQVGEGIIPPPSNHRLLGSVYDGSVPISTSSADSTNGIEGVQLKV